MFCDTYIAYTDRSVAGMHRGAHVVITVRCWHICSIRALHMTNGRGVGDSPLRDVHMVLFQLFRYDQRSPEPIQNLTNTSNNDSYVEHVTSFTPHDGMSGGDCPQSAVQFCIHYRLVVQCVLSQSQLLLNSVSSLLGLICSKQSLLHKVPQLKGKIPHAVLRVF